ncbi:MAG: hypothetical protein WC789_06680 [Lentisphaeria bacterium]|jgi:hypothetical protein
MAIIRAILAGDKFVAYLRLARQAASLGLAIVPAPAPPSFFRGTA